MKMIWFATLIAALAAPTAAQDTTRTERVRFARNANSTAVTGVVKGYDTAIYLVGARAGQAMSVDMKTSNASSYFSVRSPSGDDTLFDGTINGNSYRGKLPAAGDYRIVVFLMRNAARRNETARYTLNIGVR